MNKDILSFLKQIPLSFTLPRSDFKIISRLKVMSLVDGGLINFSDIPE